MLAVIEIWGNQFIVKKWDIIDVKNQSEEINSVISIQPLLVSDQDGKSTKIWTPLLENSKVELKILWHRKLEKVRVFKMKSKKRHMKNNWFRPQVTKLEVLSIV